VHLILVDLAGFLVILSPDEVLKALISCASGVAGHLPVVVVPGVDVAGVLTFRCSFSLSTGVGL
jgi:hypothetical protein